MGRKDCPECRVPVKTRRSFMRDLRCDALVQQAAILLTMATLTTTTLLTVATLTTTTITVATLPMATLLTVATLTVATLTMATLTVAPLLTMAILTIWQLLTEYSVDPSGLSLDEVDEAGVEEVGLRG
eukprot:scaffold9293_cov69-Phaeocystis_antarctica.AAC.1